MKAYPKTKPSGVEWLGDVPEHWDTKRLRFLAKIQTGNTPSKSEDDNYSDEGVPWVKPDDLKAFEPVTSTKEYLSPTGLKFSRPVPAWSALVCCIGTVGKFGFSKQEVTTNQQINSVVFESRKVVRKFGLYLIAAAESEHVSRANKNVVAILNTTQQSNISIALPPLPEQSAIAAYLDRETGRIDELVGKKRELIERLKEKRTALISRTVTRGLPADLPPATLAKLEKIAGQKLPLNPPLKPSGIDWLGDVPAHWEVKSLTRLTHSIRNGTSATQLEDEVVAAVPVTRIESISGGVINFEKVGLVEWTPTLEAYRLNRGDILMSHINSLTMVGNCAVYDSERPLFSGMNLLRIQPAPSVNPYWLWRVLSCDGIRKEISARAKPAINQASVTTNQIKSLILPVPPLAEQKAIAAYLDEETAKLDTLVAKVETAIDRLQEYRTALITAAVTGKIDVRT